MSSPPSQLGKRLRPRRSGAPRVDLIEVLQGTEELATPLRPDPIHWRREYYIPLRHGELRSRLANDARLTPNDRRLFEQFCKLLSATFHYEYHERAERLKGEYEPFDPDAAKPADKTSDDIDQRDRHVAQLFDNLTDLLRRANYHRLSQSQIEQAVAAASDWGVRLDVDFNVFERLEVYARGDLIGRRTRHHWRNLYRPEEVDVPIYQRLLVVFQLRQHRRVDKNLDTAAVYIKLFKNIPKEDVDMMLPGVKAKMSLIDSGKVLLPTALAMHKFVLGAVMLIAAGATGVAGATGAVGTPGLFGLAIFIGGILAFGVRSVFGYLNVQNKYQLNLTRSLYFQNLDNSSGVLLRLTDEAEEQEFYESILAYFLLWREAGPEGWSIEQLDAAAERYLTQLCGFGIDFEVDDALEKLRRLQLASQLPDGRWRSVAIEDGLRALDVAWDNYFGFST